MALLVAATLQEGNHGGLRPRHTLRQRVGTLPGIPVGVAMQRPEPVVYGVPVREGDSKPSKWRERLFPPSWSTGERVYVFALWVVIVVSLSVLIVMGVVLYSSFQSSGASSGGLP